VVMDEERRAQERPPGDQTKTKARTAGKQSGGMPFSGIFSTEDKNAGIAGILKSLHLDGLDSGDILLLLIILLVFLEGDNTELVITLGLMLLLGLGDNRENPQKE